MERELWPLLYQTVRDVGRDFRQKYVHMQPWVLLLTLLWAALHDRPVAWACQQANWGTTHLRPPRIPSQPTLSRRVAQVGTGLLWRAVEVRLRQLSGSTVALLAILDGKPLPVGGASTDHDASWGRGASGKAKGYKLHTLWSNRALPEAWEVTTLKASEQVVAQRLVRQAAGGGYVLVDGNYEGSPLFDDAARAG